MQEWLLKIIGNIFTTKKAFLWCFFCIIFIYLYKTSIGFIADSGVPEKYTDLIFFILIISLCTLFTNFSLFMLYKANSIINCFFINRNKKLEDERFRENFRLVIPKIPDEQKIILIDLSFGEEVYDLRRSEVSFLYKQKYISKINQNSSSFFVFKINSLIKDEVLKFNYKLRTEKFERVLSKLNEHEIEFLKMFYSKAAPAGTEYSSKVLDSKVYRARNSLEYNEIIDLNEINNGSTLEVSLNKEVFFLLREYYFNTDIVREVVNIESKYVQGVQSVGGGALGSGSYNQ